MSDITTKESYDTRISLLGILTIKSVKRMPENVSSKYRVEAKIRTNFFMSSFDNNMSQAVTSFLSSSVQVQKSKTETLLNKTATPEFLINLNKEQQLVTSFHCLFSVFITP